MKCIVVLEIVLYGRLCIVLVIYDIGLTKTSPMECDVFWMGDPGSAIITIYLILMTKWIATSSSLTSMIL